MPSQFFSDFDFTIGRGDDRTLTMTITNPNTGVAENIAGWSIWVTGKRRIDNGATDADAIFQYTIGDGVTVTNAAGGVVEVDIRGTDTDALTVNTILYVDIQCKDGGDVWTAATGKITVFRDVTRVRV